MRIFERLSERSNQNPAFASLVGEARGRARKALRDTLGPYAEMMDTLRETLERDAVFVRDVTIANSTWGNRLFEIYGPLTSAHAVGGGIGQGLAMGVGAKIAAQDRQVVVLCGDGGLFVNVGEMATAAQENLSLVLLVFNDKGYGVIRNIQKGGYGGRIFGVDLQAPGLTQLAETFGFEAFRVDAPAAFGPALRAALEAGNSLKNRATDYDIDAAEALMESALQVFDQPLLDELRGNGSPSDGPIFVLGMPRSGTSLVEQILSSHSRVYGAGELNEMRELVWRHLAAGANRQARCFVAGDITPGLLNKLGPSYAEAITRYAPDSPRIVDKMPLNFIYIGVIALALPNARIVHCIRDPVDTCLSCYMKIFNDAELNYSYDLNHLGRYFAAYTRLMDHWRRLLPGRMVELRYEALVAEQERETRRLLDACGLEWEDPCLRFYETERQVETASIMQVRQPIYDHAIQRWRHYEGHRTRGGFAGYREPTMQRSTLTSQTRARSYIRLSSRASVSRLSRHWHSGHQ